MKVLFASVVYPAALPYLEDFFKSLSKQTYKDFALLLISDQVDRADIEPLIEKYNPNTDLWYANPGNSPIELRIQLLQIAKAQDIDIIILGDVDDTFSPNRIDRVVYTFGANPGVDFVYNELRLMDGGEVMPSLPKTTESISDILEYNYLGLTNTALRLRSFNSEFIDSLNECKSMVFDWYLFSRILLDGHIGMLAERTISKYRIYDYNFAGKPSLDSEKIQAELKIKKQHYELLSGYDKVYGLLLDLYKNDKYKVVEKSNKSYYWWNLTRRGD